MVQARQHTKAIADLDAQLGVWAFTRKEIGPVDWPGELSLTYQCKLGNVWIQAYTDRVHALLAELGYTGTAVGISCIVVDPTATYSSARLLVYIHSIRKR